MPVVGYFQDKMHRFDLFRFRSGEGNLLLIRLLQVEISGIERACFRVVDPMVGQLIAIRIGGTGGAQRNRFARFNQVA